MVLLDGLRGEGLIMPESITQGFGYSVGLDVQTHRWLRNCFFGVTVQPKGRVDLGVIECLFLKES